MIFSNIFYIRTIRSMTKALLFAAFIAITQTIFIHKEIDAKSQLCLSDDIRSPLIMQPVTLSSSWM